ncbi:MAG: hypothetical protein MUO88_03010, partial [Desulfobacterales bacterium]|nr:hypothetical protein [Desulfobacterales bacterium]
ILGMHFHGLGIPFKLLFFYQQRFINKCPSINEDFCSRLRHAKKITTGICIIFRGLFFEHNEEIRQKDRL